MERVQIIAVAVIVAALALFGAGYLVDAPARVADERLAGGAMPDDPSRPGVRLWSSERESRRPPRRGGGGDDPPERRRGDSAGAERSAGGAATLIGGTVRSGGAMGVDPLRPRGALGGEGVPDDLLATRTGTLPRAGASGGGSPEVPAPSDPDPQPEQSDSGGVLLSIPLKGSIDPEQGGAPTRADGVKVDGDAVEFTADAQYVLPAGGHVDGAMGTIAFDVAPHWAGSAESNNSLLQIRDEHRWENNLQIVKNFDSLRFIIIDELGVETNVNAYISDWQPNESHRVTATWGEALMVLYIDGQQVGQTTMPNALSFADATPIHVGSDFPGSQYRGADGRISNLTIYGRALDASEIR